MSNLRDLPLKENFNITGKAMKNALAKQRTQLLARVREEVVGEFREETDGYINRDYLITETTIENNLIKEQLKKLEIISNECEHEPQLKTVEEEGHRYQVAGDICIKCQQLL